MLKLFLWLKYLRKRRIIFLIVAAVALSVCMLVVVASLFTGFIDAFEHSAVELLGDVVLAAPQGYPLQKYPLLIERLEQTGFVAAATPTLSSEGLLNVELGKGNVRPVSIWGIDPLSRARVSPFKEALLLQKESPGEPSWAVPGRPGETGGFVGIGVVAEPDEKTDEYDEPTILDKVIGQRMVITTGTLASGPDAPELPKPRRMPFYIADVVFAGVYDLDSTFVYVPIDALQEAIYPDANDPLASTISVKLKPGVDPDLAVAQIRGLWRVFAAEELKWGPYAIAETEIATALEMQSQFIGEFRKQMRVLLLIFGVISFSTVVLVFCILFMIVKLKQRDIAIMKSCGAASVSVAWIFLGFGVTVGVIGAGVGTVLAYAITRNINAIEGWISVVFGMELWSSSVYMFTKIPNEVDWASALPIVGLAIGAAAVGALSPAIVAALTKPVDVLRYE
jgi:ABC-type lipoprotein release transport system permease subunit